MGSEGSAHELERIFPGTSEMAHRMRSFDWSEAVLGLPETWPLNLRTCVRIILTSRQPMFIWWGKELIHLYNDGYIAILGAKHPAALAQPAPVVWSEVWDVAGPRAELAMSRDEGTYDEALPFIMLRNGYPEETYVTFSYSPIPDDQGGFGGILCPAAEDTQRIIGERQLALLRELPARTADARTWRAACLRAAEAMQTNPNDLPFALIYTIDRKARTASLAASAGIAAGDKAAPETLSLDGPVLWPLEEAYDKRRACLISDLTGVSGALPLVLGHQVRQAIALPVGPSGEAGINAVLVAGLNPLRPFDDNYRGFLEMVAGGILSAIVNAESYEAERRRAEALAELDRAKTAFFSNVSHEFRTPLTLMLGPLEDELQEQPSANGRLTIAHRNALRLLKLVNTLLDFSRIEAGRIEASYEPTDLGTLTAELASVFRSAIERAGLCFSVDCPPLSEEAYVDREMWEKIVLNLLSNAFKFTFEGEIRVVLRKRDGHVELSVKDTGIGIPSSELPRIFERFHRIRGTRSRTHEGTGIGLALVQELVKLHGGEIAVQSIEGQGTTFTVAIPLGASHLPQERLGAARTLASTASGALPFLEEALRWLPDSQTETGAGDAGPGERLRPFPPAAVNGGSPDRILLADDNADMRDYLRRLLAQEFDVTAVGDGEAAFAAACERRPDLVLSDVMMPRLDGFGLVQRLRSHPQTSAVPIILLSARAGEEARVEGLLHGADDYVTKPFSTRELLARVRTALDLRRVRREADEAINNLNARLSSELAAMTRLQEELAHELENTKTLQKIGALLIEKESGAGLYGQILDAAMTIMRADFGSIQILDAESGELNLLDWRNFHPDSANYWRKISKQSGTTCGSAFNHGERTVVPDVSAADFPIDTETMRHYRLSGIVAVQSTPLTTRHGKVIGMVSTHWRRVHAPGERDFRVLDILARQAADFFERRRTLEALRESEQRFRLLVNNVQEYALFQTDSEGKVTSWNPGAERLFGYTGAEMLGHDASRLLTEEDQSARIFHREISRVLKGEHQQDARWLLRKDGTRFWAQWVTEPVRDETGRLRGVAKILRDETHRRNTEESMRKSLVEKEELLKEVHHRVKNNLQVVISLLNLQARQIEEPRVTALFEETRNRVQAISSIHELLYRGESFATIELSAYARRLAPDLVRFYGLEQRVTLAILGDGAALELERAVPYGMLLNELVSNACKHAFPPLRDGKITIAIEPQEDMIELIVSDTGKGLPESLDYRQASSLGLMLVHGLVRQLRGTLEILSEEGTTVRVRFPPAGKDTEA